MSNYSKYHQRMNSDPSRIHDWHVRHRSLSFAAKIHADIEMPASPTRSEAADRDTGFPEPLSLDRNTTMRHPDANTSPNACIEAQDIDIVRTHQRRHTLLRERHASWRASRHGKISVDTSYASLPGVESRVDSGYGSAAPADKGEPVSFIPGSRDISESPASSPNSLGKTMRISEDLVLDKTRPSSSSDSIERKKGGLIGRIHSLRHRSWGPQRLRGPSLGPAIRAGG